ncbi:GDP-mannose 4,6-dehydratase [Hydromonas duriensis]|uniref:UDP-glucose 4-epimerase n=1 Tax=Hydromonas duriensis TaxID=1527608 RepID=A0A4R6Y4A2_9BURK|nr:GDP-mannose 4,6-dehydratase [Hydromonas duriensis]TDR27719.1 UDP-glucose 4-epimerase [Hydromonas duriensis]
MNKIVLLTGAHGFTGRYVRRALELDGFKVFGLVQKDALAEDEIEADLLDLASLCLAVARVKPNFVIHLAALAFVDHGSAKLFYDVNLFGTMNLLEALHAEAPQVEKILLSSSANVYGNPTVSIVNEDTPPSPINHYATSKLAMEFMARTWSDRLPIVFTRPFNYTGAGQELQFLIPKIVDHFRRRADVIELGNLKVTREFNDVRMIAKAYSDLMQRAEPNSLFNLCSGRGYQLTEVIQLCEQLTGHTMDIRVNPAFVRANELKLLVGDASRLNQKLPQLPKYDLKDTLTWMLK